MAWKIEFEGYTLTEREVTAAHLSLLADILGHDSWDNVNPMHSPGTLAAWCAITAMPAAPGDLATIVAFVARQPLANLVAAVSEVEDVPLHAVDTKAG